MTQPRHSSRTGHVGYIFRDMCKGFLHPGRDMTAGCCATLLSVAAAPGDITHPAVCDGRQGPGGRCPNRSMPTRHGTTAGAPRQGEARPAPRWPSPSWQQPDGSNGTNSSPRLQGNGPAKDNGEPAWRDDSCIQPPAPRGVRPDRRAASARHRHLSPASGPASGRPSVVHGKIGGNACGGPPQVQSPAPVRGHGPFRINQGADMSMARASGAVPLMSVALTLL